jgi:hypothetical protein
VSTEGQPQQSDMQWPALEIRLLEQPEHEERRRVTTLANINNHSDSKYLQVFQDADDSKEPEEGLGHFLLGRVVE